MTSRLIKNKSFEYGTQHFTVEARSEQELDAIVEVLVGMGWKDECSYCMDDGAYDGEGVGMSFVVDAKQEGEFKADFKAAKKVLK